MTKQMDALFQDLSGDVSDDGFSQAVMARIERPRTIRRVLISMIVGFNVWLFFRFDAAL